MTNYERITKMGIEELSALLKSMSKYPVPSDYLDIKGWLQSEDVDMLYKGTPALYVMSNGEKEACLVVCKKYMLGEPYRVIVIDGKVMSVPAKNIIEGEAHE